jgi:hypothetical protein
VTRSLVRSLIESIVRALNGGGAYDRIVNGGFATTDPWATTGAAWIISSGVATAQSTGQVYQVIDRIDAGTTPEARFTLTGTGVLQVRTYLDTTLVDTIWSHASSVGSFVVPFTATGSFNRLSFYTEAGSTRVLDNVSLTA